MLCRTSSHSGIFSPGPKGMFAMKRSLLMMFAVLSLGAAGCWDGEEPVTTITPVEDPTSPAVGACRVGGCSSQVCSDQDVFTTCEWRPEYACYRGATCARQANGNCGWTMTEELKACLKAAQ
jgi:hypothetical protein